MSALRRPAGRAAVTLALLFAVAGCGLDRSAEAPPLAVVPELELDRYLGTWYEIASYPNRFQEGCTATTATYSAREDGRIRVLNSCRKGRLDAPAATAEGVAWAPDPAAGNAKLKVRFFWPFSGDYWVVELAPDYTYAVVGSPSRKYLWILSRTPVMDDATYRGILSRLPGRGYDPQRLRRTPQPAS